MTATAALIRAEAKQLYRSPVSMLFSVGLPVLAVVVLAAIPATRQPAETLGGLSALEAFTAPIVMFSVLVVGVMAMPQTLGMHRESGFLRRLRTTPVVPSSVLLASLAVHALLSVAVATLIVTITLVAGGSPPAHPLLLAVVVVLMSAAFLAVGAVLCAVIPSVKVLSGVGNVVAILMLFTAGMWVPRASFPEWAQTLTDLTPGGASAELLTTAIAGGGGGWQEIAVCLAWTALSIGVAVRVFRWE